MITRYTEVQSENLVQLIYDNCKAGNGEWSQLVSAITAAGLAPKNWLKARAILQWMINNKMVKRFPSTQIEKYVVVEA